jgi:hypothetical protein
MNLFILIYSLLFQHTLINTTQTPYSNMDSSGIDGRFTYSYPFINRRENEILYKIKKYSHYMTLLKYLESGVSEKEKIERIEYENHEPTYKIYDLYAGGLMSDWDMDDWDMDVWDM